MKVRDMNQKIEDIPGYDEILQRLLESAPAERVMAIYTPEQRLAGLAPEQQLLALPVETLRALSEDYLRSLPPAIEQAIRERIARSDD